MTFARRLACALGAIAATAPGPALAQRLGGAADFDLPIVRLVLGLLFCILIAIASALAFRHLLRKGAVMPGAAPLATWMRGTPRRVRVIESHRLSPHADVCVFACEEREYLVVVSSGGATLLREQDAGPGAQP